MASKTFDPTVLKPGDWVYAYHDSGAFGPTLVPLTVVRNSPRTALVRDKFSAEFRINHAQLIDYYTES